MNFWLSRVNSLTQPIAIGIQAAFDNGSFRRVSFGKDNQAIRKMQMSNGRAIPTNFDASHIPFELFYLRRSLDKTWDLEKGKKKKKKKRREKGGLPP
jgi:hypothetical protein